MPVTHGVYLWAPGATSFLALHCPSQSSKLRDCGDGWVGKVRRPLPVTNKAKGRPP